jgi:hypothetical protein
MTEGAESLRNSCMVETKFGDQQTYACQAMIHHRILRNAQRMLGEYPEIARNQKAVPGACESSCLVQFNESKRS